MKKTILSIVLIALTTLVSNISAQGVYYYELANGNGDGHFIQINTKTCYDSDRNGISLENGLRRRQDDVNGQKVYFGDSQFGFAYYFFSDDYKKLRIVTEKNNITYNYILTTPSADAVSAHASKQNNHFTVQGSTVMPTASPASTNSYPIGTSSYPTSSSGRTCSGCGGLGLCTMCNGKGWYKNLYSGDVYRCTSCNGSGQCKVCHGKGQIK